MISKIKKLELMRIEGEKIKRDKLGSGKFRLPFKLSGISDCQWREIFKSVYEKKVKLHMENPAFVQGDEIIVIVSGSDNLQLQADIIKEVVKDTNMEVEKRHKEYLKSLERRKGQERAEQEAIEMMKEKASKVRLYEASFP